MRCEREKVREVSWVVVDESDMQTDLTVMKSMQTLLPLTCTALSCCSKPSCAHTHIQIPQHPTRSDASHTSDYCHIDARCFPYKTYLHKTNDTKLITTTRCAPYEEYLQTDKRHHNNQVCTLREIPADRQKTSNTNTTRWWSTLKLHLG